MNNHATRRLILALVAVAVSVVVWGLYFLVGLSSEVLMYGADGAYFGIGWVIPAGIMAVGIITYYLSD